MSEEKQGTVTVRNLPVEVAEYWLGLQTTPPVATMNEGLEACRIALAGSSTDRDYEIAVEEREARKIAAANRKLREVLQYIAEEWDQISRREMGQRAQAALAGGEGKS